MPRTPEQTTTGNETVYSDELRKLYDASVVNEWRQGEYAELTRMRQSTGFQNDSYNDDFKAGIDGRLDAFLATKGVSSSDDDYNELRKVYRDAAVDKITENVWGNSPASRGIDANDTESERVKLEKRVKSWHDTDKATAAAVQNEIEMFDILSEELGRIDAIYEDYAKLIAERSKSIIANSNTSQRIDELKAEATPLLSGLATMMMDDLEAQGLSDQEVSDGVGKFLSHQINILAAKMEQHRIDEYEKSSTLMKAVYNKWAEWTEQGTDKETGKAKYFSKGGIKKMLALGIPVGMLTGLAVAAAPVSVGVGVGALLAGGVAAGTRSIGRSLAGGFLDRHSKEKRLATEQSAEMRTEYERDIEAEEAQRRTIFEVLDDRSTIYRKRNRNRAIAGTAISATFGLVGGAIGAEIADKIDFTGWVADSRAGQWFAERLGGVQDNYSSKDTSVKDL